MSSCPCCTNKRHIILNNFSYELKENPIYIRIPENVVNKDDIIEFIRKVYKDFMELPYFTWFMNIDDACISDIEEYHRYFLPIII